MASSKAREYAEQQLGVNTVYQEANEAAERADHHSRKIDEFKNEQRQIEDMIADREVAIFTEERNKHKDESATWLNQHVSRVKRTDVEMERLRKKLRDIEFEVSTHYSFMRAAQATVEIRCARMHELGGYFQYLVAIMSTKPEQPAQPTTPEEREQP